MDQEAEVTKGQKPPCSRAVRFHLADLRDRSLLDQIQELDDDLLMLWSPNCSHPSLKCVCQCCHYESMLPQTDVIQTDAACLMQGNVGLGSLVPSYNLIGNLTFKLAELLP